MLEGGTLIIILIILVPRLPVLNLAFLTGSPSGRWKSPKRSARQRGERFASTVKSRCTNSALALSLAASHPQEMNDPQVTWEPDVASRIAAILEDPAREWGGQRPLMVAVVGIPGSGKTTCSSLLCKLVPNSVALPMDGYHYSVSDLKSMAQPEDMVYRRGAPDTFDAAALQRDLQSIREGSSSSVLLPGFDHAVGDPRPDAHTFVRGTHKVVVMEGLYLLHEQSGWAGISALFDLKVFLDSDVDAAVERLKIRNKCIPGYTLEEIDIRCDAVDRVNAELVCLDKVRADLVVSAVASS